MFAFPDSQVWSKNIQDFFVSNNVDSINKNHETKSKKTLNIYINNVAPVGPDLYSLLFYFIFLLFFYSGIKIGTSYDVFSVFSSFVLTK